MGDSDFTFIIYSDGSCTFSKALRPKEIVRINPLATKDVYNTLVRFYHTHPEMLDEDMERL